MRRSKREVKKESLATISFRQCPAKTYSCSQTGETQLGRDVLTHCQIVGEVAKQLLSLRLSKVTMPKGSHLVAAGHDIGKVSPCFYEKLRNASVNNLQPLLLDINYRSESQWGGHAGVSQVSAKDLGVNPLLAAILGQHHGFRPDVGHLSADCASFGGEAWQAERAALIEALKQAFDADWPDQISPSQVVLLAGLTSVADWIGSGCWFEDPYQDWQPLIAQAIREAGFTSPLLRHGLAFSDIFPFSPLPVQQALISAVNEAGVYVLEAPMGLGKTEAALYAAYQMLDQGLANGIYFALPTQLTSNKLYDRFLPFLEKILQPDCPHRQALLLHGQAWLMQTEMGEEGRSGGSWFHQAKRGLLSPFAVGTIDQALMAVMNVKHSPVRAFGLAGKVVILDEVHSYDVYTGTILNELVSQLRQFGCTVIILSATLAKSRREELLKTPVAQMVYPLITAISNSDMAVKEIPALPPPNRQIALRLLHEDAIAINEALERASQGQQVLWIENTVAEAQEQYRHLAARAADLGIECGLLHSRFTHADRQRNEDKWVALFGKEGWSQRKNQGRILLGTQVLEQSLDIDADFLLSRFAPTDMLLQRLGRLWRHDKTPRPEGACPEAWLLVPNLCEAVADPVSSFGKSAAVYNPYILCRSLESWQDRSSIHLPENIRLLIEDSYAPRKEDAEMVRWLHELEHGVKSGQFKRQGKQALQRMAQLTLATEGSTQSDIAASTRYSEEDSIEVLLLRQVRFSADQQLAELTLLDGAQVQLPLKRHQLSSAKWRERSIALQKQTLNLRPSLAPKACQRDRLKKIGLHHVFYLGSPEEDLAWLRVALVDGYDRVVSLEGEVLSSGAKGYFYREDMGYQCY